MAELRGDDLASGFVVRRYEAFTGAEARTWWINGPLPSVTETPCLRRTDMPMTAHSTIAVDWRGIDPVGVSAPERSPRP